MQIEKEKSASDASDKEQKEPDDEFGGFDEPVVEQEEEAQKSEKAIDDDEDGFGDFDEPAEVVEPEKKEEFPQ